MCGVMKVGEERDRSVKVLSSRLTILSPRVRRSWEAWGTPLDLARGDASNGDVYIGERRRTLTPSRFTPHFLCSKSELRKNTNCSLVEIDQIKPHSVFVLGEAQSGGINSQSSG